VWQRLTELAMPGSFDFDFELVYCYLLQILRGTEYTTENIVCWAARLIWEQQIQFFTFFMQTQHHKRLTNYRSHRHELVLFQYANRLRPCHGRTASLLGPETCAPNHGE
jgi:hypothetical protein